MLFLYEAAKEGPLKPSPTPLQFLLWAKTQTSSISSQTAFNHIDQKRRTSLLGFKLCDPCDGKTNYGLCFSQLRHIQRKPKLVVVHPEMIFPCRVASSGCAMSMYVLCMSERERISEDIRKLKEREDRRAGCTSELN